MTSGMAYLHAALLLHYAGKKIDEDSIRTVLKAAGVANPEEGYIKAIVTAIGKVNLSEILERAKQAPTIAMPMAATPTAAPSAAPQPPAEEKKKEEKKEEKKKEEEALAGLAALFG